ncbi:MAG TPA: N-acetyltransferase [Anaerolineales bacterium]|nr:N-acetyltransferase [Anaerolineales bacterium]
MEIEVRNEEAKDFKQVRQILCAAFPSEAESKLVDALRANGKASISLVAVQEEKVLGHILFSPVTITPTSQAKGIGLAPVAVRPDVQSQGIGSRLIREGLRLCKESGYDYCVVLGGPKYYQRFGFEKASQFGVQNEYGVDEEFMVIHFSKHNVVQGLVKYAPEFAMFSI